MDERRGRHVSVHSLTCFPLYTFGTAEQQEQWLPEMLGGDQLGAYCLSEPHAGSDVAAISTYADKDGDAYVLTGSKAWIPTAATPTSTRCSPGPATTAPAACPASSCRPAPRA